ncbi:MAG: hypothetical protein P0Y53_19155 [Candidatus Pseudobacter hemicellulosilyticus]|uniref:Lipocalin-like domain-containing protein n=1 Tax=Candidatus Pseudobacter hemicellulosilyticus TaxID=3121375 RepID=A0AAJ6BEI2_9BACT|nr:MAG: hypothetical protein P0Y53_19155 [Pseudobacter sp.]
MKRIPLFLSALLVLLILGSSCQKEVSFQQPTANNGNNSGGGGDDDDSPGESNPALLGDWDFKEMTAKTRSEITMPSGSNSTRTVTTSEYTTENNQGKISFTTTLANSAMGYTVDGTMSMEVWVNGKKDETMSMQIPMMSIIPLTTSSTPYKLIGTDSIYFKGGGLMEMPNGASEAIQPGGAKYKIDGKKLTLTMTTRGVRQVDAGAGMKVNNIYSVDAVVRYEKK